MNLGNMMPSERHQGPQIVCFHLRETSTTGKSIAIRRKGLLGDGLRVGEGDAILLLLLSFLKKFIFNWSFTMLASAV